MSEQLQCEVVRKDGVRCRGRALPGQVMCFAHVPELAEKRAVAAAQGGLNSSHGRRREAQRARTEPARLLAVYAQLERQMEELDGDGEMDPAKRAVSMAALSRAMVMVLGAGEVEAKVGELERRIRRVKSEE